MRPVGEILRAARKQKGLTIAQVSGQTKIRAKHLIAIEKNKWNKLPGIAYSTGFLRTYAEVVELNPEKVLALFRREFKYEGTRPVLPESFVQSSHPIIDFFLTIRRFLSKLFV